MLLFSISDSVETAVNADYDIPIRTVTFVPGGPARQEVTVLIVNDQVVESTETFLVQLSPVGNKVVLGSPDKTRVYIEDNDGKYLFLSPTAPLLFVKFYLKNIFQSCLSPWKTIHNYILVYLVVSLSFYFYFSRFRSF